MRLSELEKYRGNDGYINIDKAIEENSDLTQDILRETRGSQNREKDWIAFEDTKALIRTENLREEGALYTSYAELLIEEIAKQIDFPHAHYDLIEYKGEKGVLSQNVLKKEGDVLISGSTLLRNINHYKDTQDMLDFINIEDIFESFEYLNKYDNFEKQDIKKLREQLIKLTIFDIFTMNPDRNGANYAVIYNSIEKEINVSPIFDNEHSLGGNLRDENISEIISNKKLAKFQSESQLSVFEAPPDFSKDIENDWSAISPRIEDVNKKPLNWQTILMYLEDFKEIESISKFINNCYKNIDIDKAFKSIEDRIKIEVPQEYKEAVSNLYNERKNYINDAFCIEEVEYEDRDFME